MVVPHRWEQWLVLPSTKKKKKNSMIMIVNQSCTRKINKTVKSAELVQ